MALSSPAGRSLHDLRGKKVLLLPAEKPLSGLQAASAEFERREVVVALTSGRAANAGKSCLIDERGVVRRIDPLPASAEGLLAFLDEWEMGKAAFEYGCARCHGNDGRDTSFGVKSLARVGNRMTEEQVRSLLSPTKVAMDSYNIRNSRFTGRELEALLAYVRGF